MSKLKVGDKVIIKESEIVGQKSFPKGCIFEIIQKYIRYRKTFIDLSPLPNQDLDYSETSLRGWYPNRFRLATKEELNYYNFPNKLEEIICD